MKCQNCGSANLFEAKNCARCGSPMPPQPIAKPSDTKLPPKLGCCYAVSWFLVLVTSMIAANATQPAGEREVARLTAVACALSGSLGFLMIILQKRWNKPAHILGQRWAHTGFGIAAFIGCPAGLGWGLAIFSHTGHFRIVQLVILGILAAIWGGFTLAPIGWFMGFISGRVIQTLRRN